MRKILILGASSELGQALITAIDGHYDEVLCHYRSNAQNLIELQSKLKSPLTLIQADFASETSTLDFAKQIASIQDIVAVVHLPSIPLDPKAFKKSTWAETQALIEVSVHSIHEVLKVTLPSMMKAKSGKVVMVLSSVTSGPAPAFMNGYVTSKYALLGLMKALASEMAPYQVCLNAVSPSLIQTAFVAKLPELAIDLSAEKNPMKRNARLEDVVPMIQYLLGDQSDFITGQNFLISGGEH